MSAPDRFPPIEALIPHRGTMLLLDRVIEFSDEMAIAEYAPRCDLWYADEAGNMPAWIGIELMAQTVAAHVALVKRQEGLSPKMGALLGARSYRSTTESFSTGATLRIRAGMVLRDSSGLGAYECAIEGNGNVLAMAVLKVYEPENFELLVQGSIDET